MCWYQCPDQLKIADKADGPISSNQRNVSAQGREVRRILCTSIDWGRWVACSWFIDVWVPSLQWLELHTSGNAWVRISGKDWAADCMIRNHWWDFPLFGRASNLPHIVVDVVTFDFQQRCNLSSSLVIQLFGKAWTAAFIICSSMSHDFLRVQLNHGLLHLHLAAKCIKLLILSWIFSNHSFACGSFSSTNSCGQCSLAHWQWKDQLRDD